MYLLSTEMHMVTFIITAFELIMLFLQIIYFLQRPTDRKRLLYLILLIMMICYNVTSGLFPDDQFLIPLMAQNILAYFVAFSMSMYFVYYFYKAFELKTLQFFATYGQVVFLVIPFLLLFVTPYYVTGNLRLSRQLTVIIPFLYGLAFIYSTGKALFLKFDKTRGVAHLNNDYPRELIIAAFLALLCWGTLPVIVFFGDFQVLEHSVTNAGFLMLTIIYVRTSISQSRMEYEKLLTSNHARDELFSVNCKRYSLTPREVEIVTLIVKGQSYKAIGFYLGISEKTVGRHVSNVFTKVSATNKVDLINKLESR